MNKELFLRRNLEAEKGFTLIELLLVIVILGILAGMVIVVINPAVQQDKAKEGVIKGNVDKIAAAMNACASSRSTVYNNCDSFGEIGVQSPNGNPAGSWYSVYDYTSGGVQYLRAYGCYRNSNNGQCCYLQTLNLSNFTTTRQTAWTASNCRSNWN